MKAYAGQVIKNIRVELKSKTNCSSRGKLKATAQFTDNRRQKKGNVTRITSLNQVIKKR